MFDRCLLFSFCVHGLKNSIDIIFRSNKIDYRKAFGTCVQAVVNLENRSKSLRFNKNQWSIDCYSLIFSAFNNYICNSIIIVYLEHLNRANDIDNCSPKLSIENHNIVLRIDTDKNDSLSFTSHTHLWLEIFIWSVSWAAYWDQIYLEMANSQTTRGKDIKKWNTWRGSNKD